MSCLTRRSFVKSAGLGAGVASLAPVASALGTGEVSIFPVPQTPSTRTNCAFVRFTWIFTHVLWVAKTVSD